MAGVRTALKHYRIKTKAIGAKAKFYIPEKNEMNTIEKRKQKDGNKVGVYPEFFISLNTENGYTFDGGILFDGEDWKAFVYGGSKGEWYEKTLRGDYHGDRVSVEFKGTKRLVDREVSQYLVLDIDGEEVLKIGKRDDSFSNRVHSIGYEIEDASWAGLNLAKYEMNIVPTNNKKFMEYTDSNGERAYFINAKCKYASLIDELTFTIPSKYYKDRTFIEIDDNSYYSSASNVAKIHSEDDDYFKSSIDFRKA